MEPFENGHLIMVKWIIVFFWTKIQTERHTYNDDDVGDDCVDIIYDGDGYGVGHMYDDDDVLVVFI